MMNNLQIFHNPQFGNVRTIEIDGEPWLVGKDVAIALGYKDHINALKLHVESEDKRMWQITTPSRGNQQVTVINEAGFYQLCFGSKLPTARDFRRWVTNDVLKTIRKNGFYIDSNREIDPDIVIALCKQHKEAKRQIQLLSESNQLLQNQVAELTPKASYYDLILNCKDLVAITTIATDYGMSAKAFNHLLKEYGVQYYLKGQRIWILKKKYACYGYTQTKSQTYNGSDGEIHSKQHMYWTQKGRLFLYQFLKNLGIHPKIEINTMLEASQNPSEI